MCNVLLAMPDLKERQFLKDIFTANFFNVTFLPDVSFSDEAFRLTEQEDIEILIVDISTNTNLAFQYKTKILKKQPNMKVILLDDELNAQHLQTALRCGAIDYLVKPLQLEECQTAIHRAIISLNQISLLHADNTESGEEKRGSVHTMIQYIHKHYDDALTLEQLADYMHLHPSYVSRSFTEIAGMSFTQYLQYYRIEQAKKKLSSTQLLISDIAEQVGYTNLTYFSRVFKKATDLTPNQFRKTFEGAHTPADFGHIEQLVKV